MERGKKRQNFRMKYGMVLANAVDSTFGPLRKRAERAVIAPICQAPDFLILGVKIFICRQNRYLNSPCKD